MLAAGGVLGLLLMGAAVGGLMAGSETPAPKANDDEPGPDDLPGTGDDPGHGSSPPLWTGDFAEDGSLQGALQGDVADTPLAHLLFGKPTDAGTGASGDIPDRDQEDAEAWAAEEDTAFAHLDDAPDPTPQDAPPPGEAAAAPLQYDVVRTVPFGNGPDIPCVTGFDCGTDRLILDFEGTENDAPAITIDLETSPGNAVVAANGIGVTLVEGTGDLTADHVDIVMSGAVLVAELTDGGSLSDELTGRAHFGGLMAEDAGDARTGGPGDDLLTGGVADETFYGNDGADTILGGPGNDAIHGDAGEDDLRGGDGTDFLAGGDGHDTATGGAGGDLIFGGAGDDLLNGGAGHDALQGGPGADTILGEGGNDVIDGTFAAGLAYAGMDEDTGDLIDAGAGDDTIRVGDGDTVTGAGGDDTFIVGGDGIAGDEPGSARLGTITDFDPEEDQIEILYDPGVLSDPTVEVVDHPDGSGADIVLDGTPVLHVIGAQGLDPARVVLRATDSLPAPAPHQI